MANPHTGEFVRWLSGFTFELSVGILPYPITFLVTDIISEIYGREKQTEWYWLGLFPVFLLWGL